MLKTTAAMIANATETLAAMSAKLETVGASDYIVTVENVACAYERIGNMYMNGRATGVCHATVMNLATAKDAAKVTKNGRGTKGTPTRYQTYLRNAIKESQSLIAMLQTC